MIDYFGDHAGEMARLTVEHLLLVAVALGIAVLVGIPMGVLCSRHRRMGGLVLRATDIIQTIPSLALFGILIPIPFIGGIGVRTAIIALALYSLLPIVRNTLLGIEGVDPAVREAATAMGMTPSQLLRQVQLPLAIPSIVGGIRIAAVLAIGVATIAAAVGGGGLGTLIFRGVAMVDTRLILAGALPAAMLAILADVLLSYLERSLARRRGEFSA